MVEISLTPAAVAHIKRVQEQKGADQFLRIRVATGGCKGFEVSFAFDTIINTDQDLELKQDEGRLFVTDKTSYEYIKGSEINYIKEIGHSFFKLTNPNASSTCGCGTSFDLGFKF